MTRTERPRSIPGAAAAILGAALLAGAASGEPARPADSLRLRWEVGGSSDYTNEIYYLDSLATPTLVERQRFEIPEARYAGVALASIEGTRSGGRTHFSLSQELSIGDRLSRAALAGLWRGAVAPEWRLLLTPRMQYRRDRTLGRDFEEFQGTGSARLRRSFASGTSAAELGLLGDGLRTTGTGTGLLPDRWTAGATAMLEQGDFRGLDWRLDYTLRARGFPDSTVRDHFEHETQGRGRVGWGLANFLVFDARLVRRVTARLAPTSRDNFWEESGSLDLVTGAAGPVGWPARLELEAAQFDVEDEVLYFNHRTLRAQTGVRYQPPRSWTLEVGPLAEWLSAPRATDEDYLEFGGFADFETVSSGTLWNVTPSGGRRSYRGAGASSTADLYAGGRSSYRYVQLDALGDQSLPGAWRVRVAGSARWEFHDDSSQNAGSLYFSLDVRRLF